MHIRRPSAEARAGLVGRLPRPTIRLRLTLLYGGLFLISGVCLLALTYVLFSAFAPAGGFVAGPNGQINFTFQDASGRTGIGSSIGLSPQDQQTQIQALQAVVAQQHAAELNQLLVESALALGVMAVVSIALGWLVAGRVLAPLRVMAETVHDISAANLGQRLAPQGPNDELKDLGLTFDELLDRLDRSFQAQRQFVANASHELRTPLARQRTLLQVALDDPSLTLASLRATCERVLVAEVQQEGLIEALLTLARSERGLEHREAVDLGAVVASVLEQRRSEIDLRRIVLEAQFDAARTWGDPRLIERLVANLIDNAVRYNRDGGRLQVSTRMDDTEAALRVVNDGFDIAPSEVDRLFEPFKRLDADRTGHGDGWGLGLSIVRAVGDAHGATIAAQSGSAGGLEIEVAFPSATRSRAPSP